VRRLGIVFCYNRPCFLFHVPYSPPAPPPATADGGKHGGEEEEEAAPPPPATRLASELLSAFAPVFSLDGGRLVFLSQDAAARSGVHSGTASLHTLAWPAVGLELSGGHQMDGPILSA
jgi:acylaminoacyl-peptidase